MAKVWDHSFNFPHGIAGYNFRAKVQRSFMNWTPNHLSKKQTASKKEKQTLLELCGTSCEVESVLICKPKRLLLFEYQSTNLLSTCQRSSYCVNNFIEMSCLRASNSTLIMNLSNIVHYLVNPSVSQSNSKGNAISRRLRDSKGWKKNLDLPGRISQH